MMKKEDTMMFWTCPKAWMIFWYLARPSPTSSPGVLFLDFLLNAWFDAKRIYN
jgi:hypothetical protein